MILKGLGRYRNILLRGLSGYWREVLLTLRERLFALSLAMRNFNLSLRLGAEARGELSLPRRIFSLNLRARSFMLTLPELGE